MAEEIKLGKYIIKKELGRGGFGIVYETLDSVLKRTVALKVLHPPLTVDTHFLERFRKEAEVAAQMDHPNIVPLFDFNQIDGRYFITMGLMKRGSLKDHLSQYGAMGVHQAKTMLEQMASGLAYAHELGIIHRDLKPGNILIDDKGIARLSDFGFAKVRSADSLSMTVGGGLFGTPSYMAPEIWEGKAATVQSDIYSLGCIAHEMLTGQQLFQGETPIQVLHAHVKRESMQIEGISSVWQTFLDKCLESKPENRYQSVNAILEDLKWGLFDQAQVRESEIVLSGAEDEETEKPIVASLPEKVASDHQIEFPASVAETKAYPEKVVSRSSKPAMLLEKQLSNTLKDNEAWNEHENVPTPGQMLEMSPFKRLRLRKPWLLPLSLGVIILLLVVVLVLKNTRLFAEVTPTPEPTISAEPVIPVEELVEEPEAEPIEIIVVSREEGSGTRGAFVELTGVEAKNEAGEKVDNTYIEAVIQNSTNRVMMSVANEPNAIGYISLGSLNDTVKAVQIDGVDATPENVKNGSYKLARPFNIAYKAGLDEASQGLLDFILSEEGQKMVKERGYISNDDAKPFAGGKAEGTVVVAGSTSVFPLMEKLVEAYNIINPNVRVEILATGSSYGMQSTMEGVSQLGMVSRKLKDVEIAELEYKVIAIDGIAVIVHKNNAVKTITMEQIRQIFIGELTDWNLVK
jgi:phosphate transport system substrate-binding protein